jgi:hypothetical protein
MLKQQVVSAHSSANISSSERIWGPFALQTGFWECFPGDNVAGVWIWPPLSRAENYFPPHSVQAYAVMTWCLWLVAALPFTKSVFVKSERRDRHWLILLCGRTSGRIGSLFFVWSSGKVKAMRSRRLSHQWQRVFYKNSPRPSFVVPPKRQPSMGWSVHVNHVSSANTLKNEK